MGITTIVKRCLLLMSKASEYVKANRDAKRLWLAAALASRTCVECGESDIELLSFQWPLEAHQKVGGLKTPALMATRGTSWEKLDEAVNQCIVLCATCKERAIRERRGMAPSIRESRIEFAVQRAAEKARILAELDN